MKTPVKILFVEDSEDDAKLALRALRHGGFNVTHRRVQTAAELTDALAREGWDVVISDYRMPGFTGIDALAIFRLAGVDIPFILVSGTMGEETAVNAMKAGASDYVMKSNLARLAPALERELKEAGIRAEHKKIEAEVFETRNFLASIFDNNPNSIFVKNARDLRFLSVNKACEKLTGYSEKEFVGKSDHDFFPGEQADAFVAGDREILAGGRDVVVFEETLTSRDGNKKILQTKKFPILGKDGQPQYLVGMSEDITERKRGAEALVAERTLLRTLIDAMPDVIFAKDTAGRFTMCNAAELTHIGKAAEEDIVGKSVFDFHPRELAEAFHADDLTALSGKPVLDREEIGMDAAGVRRWYLTTKVPLYDRARNVVGMVGVSRDITERKRTELVSSRLAAIVESSEDAIIGRDLDGIITSWNKGAENIFGYAAAEMVGTSILRLIPADRREEDIHILAKIRHGESVEHSDTLRQTKDGRLIDVSVTTSPIKDAAGKVIGVSKLARDITERKHAERLLEQSEAKFRQLIEQADDGIFISDAQGTFVLVNSRGCELLGYTEKELIGMNGRLTYADGEASFHAGRMLAVGAGNALRFERMVKRKDASTFPAEISVKMIDNGMVQVIFHDITERRSQEKKISRLSRIHAVLSGINAAIVRIRERRELFQEACRIIVEHGHFILGWIAVLDGATGKLTAVAQAGLTASAGSDNRLFDGSTALLPGGTAAIALEQKRSAIDNAIDDAPGEESENVPDTLKVRRAAIALGAKSVIVLPLVVEGETFGILTLYASERNFFDEEEIKLLNELASDISFGLEFISKEEQADYLAYYDALTGLANRRLFIERLTQYMRSAVSGRHKLALYLIDLERFKNINDSLGRPAGDALLKQVAEWLTPNVGDTNLAARLGADHFAVVLPEVENETEVAAILEKTMDVFLQHPFRLNDAVFRIAAKAGVTVFPDDGTDADTLFRNAEAALKKAKVSGDRYLFYTQRMTEKVAGNLTLENQLRQALDNQEFVLHYQAKVNLVSGKVTGTEALIRWNDPRTGLVPPGRFIPILEETGLIHEVGRWAMHKALEDYLRWHRAELAPVRIAVNVSPLQLRHRDFIAEVAQAIGFNVHAAGGLELEITESLIMEDVKHSIASLEAIRAMGICVAIDDFGTGFSSLSYLAKLPVDTLKIDRSFIIDMTAGPEGLALVSAIIGMAHALKLKVVAEGVETEEQLRLLRLVGCDEMQGYLFSKPVPADVFEARFLATVAETVTADITHH